MFMNPSGGVRTWSGAADRNDLCVYTQFELCCNIRQNLTHMQQNSRLALQHDLSNYKCMDAL